MPEGHAPSAALSRGRGGPSIGAPAGTGEPALAVPAGVDGLLERGRTGRVPGAPDRRPASPGATGWDGGWDGALDELEARLETWRAALRGEGAFPDDYRWPQDLGDCPDALRGRARRILAMQRDVEDELTARRAALGALLHGIGTTERRAPVPLFIDQRT